MLNFTADPLVWSAYTPLKARVAISTHGDRRGEAVRSALKLRANEGLVMPRSRAVRSMKNAVRSSSSKACVELSEPEAWSLAVEWLLNAEKRTPVDKTPQELVAEAESTIFGVAGDNEHLLVRAETTGTLREHAIGELTPESTNRLLGFMSQAIIEHAKRILVRHSDRTLNLNPRFSDAKPINLPLISFARSAQVTNASKSTPAGEPHVQVLRFVLAGLNFDPKQCIAFP